MSIAIALHVLAAVVWVGGMFFAYLALRPAAAALEPPLRLALWRDTLRRFFAFVWASVAVLLASGYWMVFGVFGGFATVGVHVHVMNGLGVVMVLLFAHVWFAPFGKLGRAVDAGDWPEGAKQLNRIRVTVAVNLVLGVVVVAVAAGGRYL